MPEKKTKKSAPKMKKMSKKVVPTVAPEPAAPVVPAREAPAAAPEAAPVQEAAPAPARATVKYTVTTTECDAPGGVLAMEALDEELCISFAFPGDFVARLRGTDGGTIEGEGVGMATVFRAVEDGAAYVLEVDEDPEHAVESVAVRAAPAAAELSQRTAAANDITATLRGMSANELRGAEYEALLEARAREDVMQELGSG